MLREAHANVGVPDGLLEQSEVRVVLDRLGRVESKRAFGDDDALTEHPDGRVEEVLRLGARRVWVLEQVLLQALRTINPCLRDHVFQLVLGRLVRLDLAERGLGHVVVHWGEASVS